jgi:GTP cyclohydrolase II
MIEDLDQQQINVERAIAEVRAGRAILLHEDVTNLFVFPVDALDASAASRIERYASGQAYLALTPPRLKRLGLETKTAGFVTLPRIDVDRVLTLAAAANARLDAPVAAASPLFENALELLRLAQVLPAAVIIPAKTRKARSLLSVAASEVAAYRERRAETLRIVSRAPTPLEGAPDSEFVVFRGGEGLRDQVAVLIGKPDLSAPVTVRVHSACLTGDLFGSLKCDCGDQLRHTARHMAQNGGGIVLYLDQEGRGAGLSNKIRAYRLQADGFDTFDADEILGYDEDRRTFAFAAQMLKLLGVAEVRLMTNNPRKISDLRASGLTVVSDHRIIGRSNRHNIRYLHAKRDRAGHLFD